MAQHRPGTQGGESIATAVPGASWMQEHIEHPINPTSPWREIRRWVVILVVCLVAAVAAGILITLSMPKVYESKASIFVQTQAPSLSLPSGLPQISTFLGMAEPSSYALALLESDDFAREIVRLKSLTSDKRFSDQAPLSANDALLSLKRAVRIEMDSNNLIVVTAGSGSPELSAELANSYVELLLERVADRNARKRTYLDSKLQSLETELSGLEDRLRDLSARAKLVNLTEQTKAAIAELSQNEAGIRETDARLAEIESKSKTLGNLEQLAELRSEKAALIAKRERMQEAAASLQERLKDVPAAALVQTRLQREIDLKAKLYDALSQQHQLAQVDEQAEARAYQWVDRARPQHRPARPRPLVNLAVAILLGLTLGVGVNLVISEFRAAAAA